MMGSEGLIYVRVVNNNSLDWVVLNNNNNNNNNNDDDVSREKATICGCLAEANLSPCLPKPDKEHRMKSMVASAGSRIYVFGGLDFEIKGCPKISTDVSYIDTLRPQDGWKVCNPMAKGRSMSYVAPLGDGRLFVIGGLDIPEGDHTYAQIFNPCMDTWSALENYPSKPPLLWSGHGVVDQGSILLHSSEVPKLYSYDADEDSWGFLWGPEFRGDKKRRSAFVDGIYYVLDLNAGRAGYIFGYDVSLEHPKCLPVEILMEQKKVEDEEWIPALRRDNYRAQTSLLALGNNKLAMVWPYLCLNDAGVEVLTIMYSIFEMVKEEDAAGGGLKLFARPLSQACYHVNGDYFDSCLAVISFCKPCAYSKHIPMPAKERLKLQSLKRPRANACLITQHLSPKKLRIIYITKN